VLIELLSRRSVEWIVASLDEAPDGTDPFGYVLELDRTLSARDLHAAKVAEARWEEEKQRESTTGEQSILELLGSVAKRFGQSE